MESERFHLNLANIFIVNETHSSVNEFIKILESHGYNNINRIFECKLAIEIIKKEIPDLILIYVGIHNLSAYELCGNDYLVIPFNESEVVRRIEIYLRFKFMNGKLQKYKTKQIYNKLITLNEELIKENKKLESEVLEKNQQLEDIAVELKEFNVLLEEEINERTKTEEAVKENERQKIYELKEYDKIRTEFFSNISHEFRTPINVIFSALQMFELNLKDYELKSKNMNKTKYIKIMKQNCYRILRLINNIIDITKIDSGYFDISKHNVNIVSLVENITLSVADYIENKGISLIFDTDTEEKAIACDSEKMERVILNLLSNAVKFTSTGGEITVKLEDCLKYMCIKIKDTGRDIPKKKLDSIFERFVQVDKSLTRDHEGSGIGLSLVKSLVELHGGTISVESDVKQGTEFIINIPCELVEESEKESLFNDSINKNHIEKINIEFSDIYN